MYNGETVDSRLIDVTISKHGCGVFNHQKYYNYKWRTLHYFFKKLRIGPEDSLYHDPTLTMDVRRYKYESTIDQSVVITLFHINRRYISM
jgi:hypothetical protein